MSFIEFAYNRSVHSTTDHSPFEIVYGFNPLTPLDLIPLSIDKRVSFDGSQKTQVVKDLHAKIRQQIEKRANVDKKIKSKILDVYEISIVPLLCPETKENADSRLT